MYKARQRRSKSARERADVITTELCYIRGRFEVYGLKLRHVSSEPVGGLALAVDLGGKQLATYYATTSSLHQRGKRIPAADLATALRLVVDGWGLKPIPTAKPVDYAAEQLAPWE